MQGRVHTIILTMLASVLCSGCASWFSHVGDGNEKQSKEKKALPPLHLGAVHQVYPAQKFALLRIIGPIPVPGTTLISHPADGSTVRLGNLMVSENSSPRSGMLVADIRSGSVASGDRVFLYRNIALPDETDLEKARAQRDQAATGGEPPKPPPLRLRDNETTSAQAENAPQSPPGEDEPVVETPPLPEEPTSPTEPAAAESPEPTDTPPPPPTPPQQHPDYIDDIPDNIDGWN